MNGITANKAMMSSGVTSDNPPLLLVFAKAPRAGQVKTRLQAELGRETALAVHGALLRRTLALAGEFPGRACLMLDQPDQSTAEEARTRGLELALQEGEGLGERMENAMRWGLGQASRVILVGSDCPLLSLDYLALAGLALVEVPVVLGASEDGGFVLLGGSDIRVWRRPVFERVRLSTEWALADTVEALAPRCATRVLPALWDVDLPGDVQRARRLGLLP